MTRLDPRRQLLGNRPFHLRAQHFGDVHHDIESNAINEFDRPYGHPEGHRGIVDVCQRNAFPTD